MPLSASHIQRSRVLFGGVLSTETLDAVARRVRLVRRERVVSAASLFWAFMVTLGAQPMQFISDVLRTLNAREKSSLRYKPFWNRLAQPAFCQFMELMFVLLCRDMAQRVLTRTKGSVAGYFSEILRRWEFLRRRPGTARGVSRAVHQVHSCRRRVARAHEPVVGERLQCGARAGQGGGAPVSPPCPHAAATQSEPERPWLSRPVVLRGARRCRCLPHLPNHDHDQPNDRARAERLAPASWNEMGGQAAPGAATEHVASAPRPARLLAPKGRHDARTTSRDPLRARQEVVDLAAHQRPSRCQRRSGGPALPASMADRAPFQRLEVARQPPCPSVREPGDRGGLHLGLVVCSFPQARPRPLRSACLGSTDLRTPLRHVRPPPAPATCRLGPKRFPTLAAARDRALPRQQRPPHAPRTAPTGR